MKRLVRPAVFTALSVAALVTFVWAATWSVDPLDWREPGAWLDRVDPVDALVEAARWLGIVLAAYVAVVSLTALLAELSFVVRMPRLGRGLRRLAGAVAVPALRRRLVEVTTAVTITASSINASPTFAAAPVAATAVVDGPELVTAPIRGAFEGFGVVSAPAVDVDGAASTYVVQPGDTLWRIVERHYGWVDANLVRQVAGVSRIEDVNRIWPGDVVSFPAVAVATPTVVRGEATWAAATVRPGDTLWAIVESHYGEANADRVWDVVDANPEITDPGLIVPGQVITLPPLNGGGASPVEPTVSTSPPIEEVTLVPAVVEEAATTVPTAPPEPVPVTSGPPPTTAPADAVPTALPVSTAAPESAPAPPSTDQAASNGDGVAHPPIAAILGWTGGAGLAAALLAMAARRRRRMPIAGRHARPSTRGVELGIALRETENLPLVEWASLALRYLGSRLRPRAGETTPIPMLMRLEDESVELVWDTPNGSLIEPWSSDDGGWSWRLRRSDRLEATDASAPCPALVTVGRRDGADVFLNLESCGVLALTGDGAPAVVRSIATEAAAGPFGDAPTVLMIGVTRLPAEPEFARTATVTEMVGWLRDRADAAGALLAHRRFTSLFALRARSKPHEAFEPVVVVVDSLTVLPEDLDRIVGLANGDLGAVVLVLGDHPSVSWRLECTGSEVTLQPLGLQLDSVGVALELDDLVDEFVPEADLTVDDVGEDGFEDANVDTEQVLADHLDVIATRQLAPADRAAREPEPASVDPDGAEPDKGWDVELKVLGQVSSAGTKAPLTPTELHLAIYLALNRGGQNIDTLETMLWPNGAASRTVNNAMAGLRRKLGVGGDGEPLFPHGRNASHLYRLSKRVTTDWDRFVELVRRSDDLPTDEALPLLDEALALITGPPFRAKFGYSWAFSDGTVTLITETIKAVGECCVGLHTERGEITEAAASMAKVMAATGTDEFV